MDGDKPVLRPVAPLFDDSFNSPLPNLMDEISARHTAAPVEERAWEIFAQLRETLSQLEIGQRVRVGERMNALIAEAVEHPDPQHWREIEAMGSYTELEISEI